MNIRLLPAALAVTVALAGGFLLGRLALQPAPPQTVPAPPSLRPIKAALQQLGLRRVFDLRPATPALPAIDSYEQLLYAQPQMLAHELAQLAPSSPSRTNLYALGFAGDAEENVFRNEVAFLPELLAQRFAARGRSVQLINSFHTYRHTPLATRSNLFAALRGMAQRMDPDNDILLLFLTSHGSHDHQLYVAMGDLPLDQITPQDLRLALDRAGIRWRVVVISACYSGGFIPALREPHTLVITAARADRPSFGCGSDAQLTWFGKAFLVNALNHDNDFRAAFAAAKADIAQWERRDHQTPSEPQLWEGAQIAAKLAQWRAGLPANSPAVPFAPTRKAPDP